MTTLFLDTFGGSGSLSNRTPDIGPIWRWTSVGQIVGGELIAPAVGGSSTAYFDGDFDFSPPNSYAHLTFSVIVNFANGNNCSLGFGFGVNPERDIFGLNAQFGVNELYAIMGAMEINPVSRPGVYEFVQTIDYTTRLCSFYVNGLLVQSTQFPNESGQGGNSYTPNPNNTMRLSIFGYGPIGTGLANPASIREIRVTDESYPPVTPPEQEIFWRNLVLCNELV